jgi:deoxyribose-phosphate aldolase
MEARIEQIITEVLAIDRAPEAAVKDPEKSRLAGMLDHTLLKPDATESDIRQLCEEAITYGFATVCVYPCWVPFCVSQNADKPSKVCTVVGFPLGGNVTAIKAAEAAQAVEKGAHEIDMVLNIGYLKSGKPDLAEEDIRQVVQASAGKPVKVIIETCLLSDEEKVIASLISQRAGAAFVKTSTGFSKAGANAADVALIRRAVGPEMGVKASGGIRTYDQAMKMVEAGATRLGTSSSVEIVS